MRLFLNGIELPDRTFDWIQQHRVAILLTVLAITALAAWPVSQLQIQKTLLEAFVDDPTEFQRYVQRAALLGGDSDNLIFAATEEGDALFTAEKMNAIRAAAEEFAQYDEFAEVISLPDAIFAVPAKQLSVRQLIARRQLQALIENRQFDPQVHRLPLETVWPPTETLQAKVDLQRVKKDLLANENLLGGLLSQDGSAHAILLRLRSHSDLTQSRQIALTKEIESTLRRHGLGDQGVYIVGLTISQGWMFREMNRALLIYFPLGLLIIFAMVTVTFQRVSVVLLTAVIGVIANLWGIGCAAAVFGQLGILVAAAPLVIFVISTSDVIHLTAAYKLELAAGLSRDEALRKTLREVGGACVLTSVTTFVGFLSLMAVPAPMTRHLALAVAVGVASAMLLALTVLPIAYAFVPPLPSNEEGPFARAAKRVVDGFVHACLGVSLGYSKTVLVVCLILTGCALMGLSQIHVDADFPERFASDHPLRRGVRFFNEKMAGTTTVEIFVSSKSGSVLEPQTVHGLETLQRRLVEVPGVRGADSIGTLYQAARQTFDLDEEFPATTESARAWLQFFRAIDNDRIAAMITESEQLTRVSVRLIPHGYIEVAEQAKELDRIAREVLPPTVEIDTSGSFPIIGRMVSVIAVNQLYGLGICFLSISLIMAIGTRSLRNALLAQIPNMLPAALLLGFLAVTLPTVDTDLLGIPTVALGIAVDDTIHFMHRFQLQKNKGSDRITALHETFQYSGRAIVQTTLILCLGFLPFALSSFLSVWMLGSYLVLTLLCAVLGDLILLPAMIKLGVIR